MFDYSSRLAGLGYRPLKEKDDLAGYDIVSLLEHTRFGIPEDYREFLAALPFTGVFDKKVIFSGIHASPWAVNGNEVLEVLYGYCSNKSNDLLRVREQYSDQLPEQYLAIGQVTGANLVCLDMSLASFGHVYVWDHEHFGEDRKGFYLTARSFRAFIESLRFGSDQPSEGGPKLVKMELSASLKARIADTLKGKDGKS